MKRAERLNQELIFLSSKKSFNLSDLIKGIANFVETGEDFNMMKERYPFLRKVLEIKVESAKQLL